MGKTGTPGKREDSRLACFGCAPQGWGRFLKPQAYGTSRLEKGLYCP